MVAIEQSDFDNITLDSSIRNTCSPEFDKPELKGIKINAPQEIELVLDEEEGMVSALTRFPVCISMQFPLKEMIKLDEPRSLVSIVLVNKSTGDSFSCNLAYSRPRGPLPVIDLPEEIIETRVKRYYYNVNLTSYLKLPIEKGIYYLYGTFEAFKSNTLTVKLK